MGVPLSSPNEPASGVGPVLASGAGPVVASGAVPLAASGAVPPSTPGATGMPPLLLPVTGPPVPPEPDPPAGAPDSEAPSLDREPSRVDASLEHPPATQTRTTIAIWGRRPGASAISMRRSGAKQIVCRARAAPRSRDRRRREVRSGHQGGQVDGGHAGRPPLRSIHGRGARARRWM